MSIVNPSAPDSSVCIPVLHCALLSRVVYYEHPPMWWHSGVKISPQLLRRNVKFCYYFILFYCFYFFYSKSSTKRDISFHHKLGVQINIICIHKSNLAQFSVYPIYILECDRWDFPPPYFQFEIENAVIMCKLKGFYLHEIWGNKHNLGDAFLLMEKLWWVLEINTHQECEMISSFCKLCTKNNDYTTLPRVYC